MKKIKLIFIYFLLTVVIFAQEGYIASFNTLRLGKSQKDYTLTAQTLEMFDIAGLIEVMDVEGVEKLVNALNKVSGEKWDYHISPYPVGKNSYKEYFAYIWKRDKVEFLKERGFYKDAEEKFARPPYGADFKIGEFDFTFVLVHSVFGKNESARRAEAFKMNEVYDYFQNMDSEENDIIIAGDFNLSGFDESFEKLLSHPDKITYALSPVIKTTLGKKNFANSYDNMFLSTIYTKEFTGKSGALDFTQGQYRLMKDKISDHLPIFIVVEISEDDD
ncbi:endonuclease/exonuclease/phosphatase family protein [Fusobacterium varium]